ncbi:hypothetical protein B0H12DRAFT_1246730 [Mycena haematopus]|nr:hypothetical protein B0H12DRAFT_1246730 [Mycena haematopus]
MSAQCCLVRVLQMVKAANSAIAATSNSVSTSSNGVYGRRTGTSAAAREGVFAKATNTPFVFETHDERFDHDRGERRQAFFDIVVTAREKTLDVVALPAADDEEPAAVDDADLHEAGYEMGERRLERAQKFLNFLGLRDVAGHLTGESRDLRWGLVVVTWRCSLHGLAHDHRWYIAGGQGRISTSAHHGACEHVSSGKRPDATLQTFADGRLVMLKGKRRVHVEVSPPRRRSLFKHRGSPRKKGSINTGPPSRIRAYSPPSKSGIRYIHGKRRKREVPLTADDLYLDDARPSTTQIADAGHRCPICQYIKSHPVANKCGHSYCYVCIRLRLEQEWTCPVADCNRISRHPPTFDVGEAASVATDYPDRVDESTVSFSWDGLSFPFRPKSILIPPTP